MKAFIPTFFIFALALTVSSTAHSQQAYIKAGEAQAKKSNLAFPLFNSTGSDSALAKAAATDIYNTSKSNFELSSYFVIMSNQAYLEDPAKTSLRPAPADSNGFKFEPLKTIGAEFLIRSGYTVSGQDLNVEMYLYHVSEGRLILGKRYRAPLAQAKQIGHTLANDVIEALTGTRAPFMAKIVTAFEVDSTGSKEIGVMSWDGSGFQQLTSHKSIALSPSWSADGKKIAYSVFSKLRQGTKSLSNVSLYVLDLNNNKRVLTSYRPGVNSGAVFSKDGKFLFLGMSMGSGASDIYKINMKGEIETRLTNGPAGAINVEPTLSPDGTKVAFSSERGGRPMIYVMNTDGSNVKRLTFQGKYNASPSWSPDGKKIAFAGQDGANFDIYVMNADGTGLKRLTSATRTNGRPANNEDPSFSPDSRYLVYTSNRTGSNQIYISTVDGSEERRVTNDNRNYYRPKWSVNLE